MLTLEYLGELLDQNREAAKARVNEFSLAGTHFAFNSAPAIMGVINLSPESWYRESVCLSAEKALARGRILAAQGAHIIDIGAESTLAHAALVDDAGQQSKLLPVVSALRKENILVSVETYHPSVTKVCLEAGANILNLTGANGTAEMYKMVAAHDAAVIICFVQGPNVREVGDLIFKGDFISVLYEYFAKE